ncbi:hypothetical protein MA16_Dca009503 [Dendrobium catenatum]|uniref:Uncharacterized protein n=1 Tax=Dendrobium catenatum TaxID=906689 RepID=A0A2I0X558_9ASPA|nr:hypothetical protein MA16_Dca009503 [Dendrobium catenatum]
MTGDADQFVILEVRVRGKVTLGANTTRKVVGGGIIRNSKNFLIENVLLIDELKHNLLSIGQLCDKGYCVKFFSTSCILSLNGKDILNGKMVNNVYTLDLNYIQSPTSFCLKTISDESWLWHMRLCHSSMKNFRRITQKNLVRGIPKLEFTKDHLCDACQLEKQVKSSFSPIRILELVNH